MSAPFASPDVYAATRQTAARALLESTTLDGAVAEILRAHLERSGLAADALLDRRPRRQRAALPIDLGSDGLKRADVVEASRVGAIAEGAKNDPARAGLRTAGAGLDRGAGRGHCAPRQPGRTGGGGRPPVVVGLSHRRCRGRHRRDRALLVARPAARGRDAGLDGGDRPGDLRGVPADGGAGDARSRPWCGRATSSIWCSRPCPTASRCWTATGAIIYANDAAARATGFASGADMLHAIADEITQRFQFWDEAGHPLAPEALPGRHRAQGPAREAGWSATGLSTAMSKAMSTSTRSLGRAEAVPITDARGRVHRVLNINHDMTTQQRVETRERPADGRGAGGAPRARGSARDRARTICATRWASCSRRRRCCSRATCRPTSRSGRAARSRRSSAPATG